MENRTSELTLVGTEGSIRAGYQVAARFGSWRLETIAPATYRVRCHLLRQNHAWFAYSPLSARIRLASGIWWSFTVEGSFDVDVDDGERIATFHVAGDPMPVQGG